MNFFLNVVADAILIKASSNPVKKYILYLQRGYLAKKLELDSNIEYLKNKKIKKKERRDKIILRLKNKEKFKKNKEKDKLEFKIKKLKEDIGDKNSGYNFMRIESHRSKEEFEKWRSALGRPPYSEEYKDVLESAKIYQREGGHDSEKNNTIIGKVKKVLQSLLWIFSACILAFEIAYTQPGFFLYLHDQTLSSIAAFLYIAVLVTLGHTIRVLTRYSFSKRIPSQKTNENYKNICTLESKINKGYTFLLSIVILLSIVAILGGVMIRGLIPISQSIEKEIAYYRVVEKKMSLKKERGHTLNDLEKKIYHDAQTRRNNAFKLSKNIVKDLKLEWNADSLIAFVFYSVIVLSLFIKGISKSDPVFEYQLAYEEYTGWKKGELVLEPLKKIRISNMELDLKDLEIELDELNKEGNSYNDIEDNNRVQRIDAEISSIDLDIHKIESSLKSFETQNEETIRFESLRYAKYLSFLKRTQQPMDEWEEIYNESLS